jgi:hypothetical protein
LLGYLAIVNFPGPALDFVLMQQDVAGYVTTEVLELQSHPSALSAPEVAGALEEPLRVILEINEHPRQVRRELMEGHRTVDMAFFTLGAPCDALIRHLIYDLRRPRAM